MNEVRGSIHEGYLPVRDGWVWYQAVGVHHQTTPLLVLHGGPGAGSAYLESLTALADHRCVVFYDQLGCGRSEEPNDSTLWRIERFVEEINDIRQVLNLKQLYLFGHSWGGWLSIEYLLTQPPGVLGVILASTSASMHEYRQEIDDLKRALPPEVYQTMEGCELAADYQNPAYKAAILEFYNRHLCRLQPWPQIITDNVRRLTGNVVYETMQGPNELVITGNLKDWDRTSRLGEIQTPALITVGRYDEATPACATTLLRNLPDAQLVVFEHSAHMPHLEERNSYIKLLHEFLLLVDTQQSPFEELQLGD